MEIIQISDFIISFGPMMITLFISLLTIFATYKGYSKQKKLERKENSYQQKFERYETFMSSLPGLYGGFSSLEENTKMKKEFILNFYRLHLSCSAEHINKISRLIESLKVGTKQSLSDDEKNTLTVNIINYFRKDLGLDEIDKFNHYGW